MDAADGFAGPAEPELADGAVLWMEWQRRERGRERERERETKRLGEFAMAML